MPEDTKKTHQKGKNDPKEQRRKRQPRQPAEPVIKKVEKEPEKRVPVPEKPVPPVYEPPPEFYQNLKRETDDILKITEEANAKYQKKEIQSNWAKYEMPIESYEEMDEQENLGADYQALIDASLSVGGHFQFKHEKSWDVSTGPSPYDKYFEINMANLNLALSSIPFYDRNSIDLSLFNESDIQSMEHRATKFKQKYFNNKEYTTPELQAYDKILNSIKSTNEAEVIPEYNLDIPNPINESTCEIPENTTREVIDKFVLPARDAVDTPLPNNDNELIGGDEEIVLDIVDNKDDGGISANNTELSPVNFREEIEPVKNDDCQDIITETANSKSEAIKELEQVPKEQPRNPIIESPEDLEKWLDDFLDG